MEFRHKIRERRLELGLTTDEVAKVVGVSNATISRWETGNIKNQRRDKLELLAKALLKQKGAYLLESRGHINIHFKYFKIKFYFL